MHPMVPAAAPKCSARCACTAKVQRKCHGNGFGLSSRPAQGESCGGWRLRRGTARAGLRMPFHTTEGDGIGIDGLGDRREPQMASFQRKTRGHRHLRTVARKEPRSTGVTTTGKVRGLLSQGLLALTFVTIVGPLLTHPVDQRSPNRRLRLSFRQQRSAAAAVKSP